MARHIGTKISAEIFGRARRASHLCDLFSSRPDGEMTRCAFSFAICVSLLSLPPSHQSHASMPARTTLARLALSSLLTSAVNGLFFTNPSASTVWSDAAGQPITWQLTKGDPPIGTLILQSYESVQIAAILHSADGFSRSSQESVVIGDSVSVAALSYSFPSGISLASDDSQYVRDLACAV